MHLRYPFRNNQDPHFHLLPAPSAHLSVHPSQPLLPHTVHLFHLFSPGRRSHQSVRLPHLLLPDHPLPLLRPLLLLQALLSLPPPLLVHLLLFRCCFRIRQKEKCTLPLPEAGLMSSFSYSFSSCMIFIFIENNGIKNPSGNPDGVIVRK